MFYAIIRPKHARSRAKSAQDEKGQAARTPRRPGDTLHRPSTFGVSYSSAHFLLAAQARDARLPRVPTESCLAGCLEILLGVRRNVNAQGS